MLKTTTEILPNRQLHLTIEVDEEQTQKAMRNTARRIASQVNIPGFRKGKAPYELIVRRFGEEAVRKEAADDMIEKIYREAVAQEKIEPYAPGALDAVELAPFVFQFTIPLPPLLDLGDYRAFRLKHHKVRVLKKEVQQALEEIRKQNAFFDPVERPLARHDGAQVNLVGRSSDGIPFLQRDEGHVLLEDESDEPAPGFIDAIVGMEADEERTFTLTLPDDFPQEELRGQEAEFTIKVLQVYESTLPELDDDLARTVGNFDSFEQLKEQVKEQLRQTAQQKADEEYTAQVLKDMLEQAQIEFPPVMLKDQLDDVVKEVEQTIKRETRLPLEDYLRYQNQTMEELRDALEPSATFRLKRALMLGEIVRLEDLTVDEEEIDAHIKEISALWGTRADEVRTNLYSPESQRAIRSRLLADKALELLVAIAKGEAPEPPPAEEREGEETESATAEEGEE